MKLFLFLGHFIEVSLMRWLDLFIVEPQKLWAIIMEFLIVRNFVGNRIALEAKVLKTLAPSKVVQLVQTFHIVAFKIQDLQMLKKTDIKEVLNVVIGKVKFFKVLKSLNTLDFSELTSREMENPHEFKGGA